MKKTIILLLCLALVCCVLAGCSDSPGGAHEEGGFRVGYAKNSITPENDVPLRGYGNTSLRISNGYFDDLYATCTAITDENGNTILMFALDMANCSGIIAQIRREVSEATGVPVSNVLFSASHTHSAPDMDNAMSSITKYSELLKKRILQTALDALEDRENAQMYINTVQTENLNFVRRYVLENGEAAGDNYGDFSASPIAGHESEVDASMQLIKFKREGRKDLIMANFQVHPHRAGGADKLYITADLVGAFREKMETTLDCEFIYFSGGSGNINPTSRITEENVTSDYLSHGQALADYAIAANDSYTQVETGNVQALERTCTLNINHRNEDLLGIATQIDQLWAQSNNVSACVQMGEPYGINSPYHASGIVRRSSLGQTGDIEIHAFSIGDVAFITAPYEMFDSNGMQIKEGSPFKMTFIATLANESKGYIPSELGWQNGGYSVDTTTYEQGSAEYLVEQYLQMLQELYTTK